MVIDDSNVFRMILIKKMNIYLSIPYKLQSIHSENHPNMHHQQQKPSLGQVDYKCDNTSILIITS